VGHFGVQVFVVYDVCAGVHGVENVVEVLPGRGFQVGGVRRLLEPHVALFRLLSGNLCLYLGLNVIDLVLEWLHGFDHLPVVWIALGDRFLLELNIRLRLQILLLGCQHFLYH
jgi:hypothetical protein